jgi:hypothetical protein
VLALLVVESEPGANAGLTASSTSHFMVSTCHKHRYACKSPKRPRGQCLSAGTSQMRPLSRGYVEAKSDRPGDMPAIYPRYLIAPPLET